ncbi:MAG: hypothetical protein JOY99_09825, partial [Sphingomonadaceae bacterium]|nr:hypothetical protein [Sphingomonadaceae bacterium]
MSSRYRISLAAAAALLALAACQNKQTAQPPVQEQSTKGAVIDTALVSGVGHSVVTIDPRAAPYYDNANAVADGKRLY